MENPNYPGLRHALVNEQGVFIDLYGQKFVFPTHVGELHCPKHSDRDFCKLFATKLIEAGRAIAKTATMGIARYYEDLNGNTQITIGFDSRGRVISPKQTYHKQEDEIKEVKMKEDVEDSLTVEGVSIEPAQLNGLNSIEIGNIEKTTEIITFTVVFKGGVKENLARRIALKIAIANNSNVIYIYDNALGDALISKKINIEKIFATIQEIIL